MDVPDPKRLRELEGENAKVKKLLAEARLDMHALKSVLGVKPSPASQTRSDRQDDAAASWPGGRVRPASPTGWQQVLAGSSRCKSRMIKQKADLWPGKAQALRASGHTAVHA